MTDSTSRRLFFFLFAISGFSGLIYESIWTHYLKLFLGHAAYAQTLVLAIFMGGMALGAWACSRASARWGNLLRTYALVEGVIGVCALLFHEVFSGLITLAYDSIIPALGSQTLVMLFKWGLAGLLILPQSVLLGMTFPLMSAGIIRRHPAAPGGTLAMLYFSNSLGGAIGVLVSGFVLIKWIGLPGTIAAAGVINVLLAATVWYLAGAAREPALNSVLRRSDSPAAGGHGLLLLIAALTGLASFIYEIGWIRMLSLVLGSSTHAFELMLSAFIFGLAFGGLWIRRRIDRIAAPISYLGWLQVAMGLLALSTLLLYGESFNVMQWLLGHLDKTETGYSLFNLASHGIAMAIMLPTTFCAGMTLPLLTYILLRRGHGEASIGAVYGANTLGAIAGVFFAVHVGMPLLGLKGLIISGGALDIALGLVLLWRHYGVARLRAPALATAVALLAVGSVLLWAELDVRKMASGVYRSRALFESDVQVFEHRDGKTASVALTGIPGKTVMIRTNGKADAAIAVDPRLPYNPDEATMILAGALPQVLRPEARTVANIGMGSGLTSHTLLASPQITTLDTIEIEPAMVEAARGFLPRNQRVYSDPRSHIHIEDAKTFFSTHRSRYDVIVSEPSNPWVSGVAGLFSEEFYHLAKRHLAADGLLVQWVQLYEINEELVASVLKALSAQFADYAIYVPNHGDMIIVASDAPLSTLSEQALMFPALQKDLARIGVRTVQDIELHKASTRRVMEPLLARYEAPANSDFYPVLDQNAARARFMDQSAIDLLSPAFQPLPALELLAATSPAWQRTDITLRANFLPSRDAYRAALLRDFLTIGKPLPRELGTQAETFQQLFFDCSALPAHGDRVYELFAGAEKLVPYLRPQELEVIWQALGKGTCLPRWSDVERKWLEFFMALGRRDGVVMAPLASELLQHTEQLTPTRAKYLLASAMLGFLSQGDKARARGLWQRHSPALFQSEPPSMLFRLLAAQAAGV